jgi:putative transposase
MITKENKTETKTQIAKNLGISRSSLYYQAKREELDNEMKNQILIVLGIHPSYGHKRIALEFNLNNKRIRRVMKKYGLKPYRRRIKRLRKKEDEGKPKTKWDNQIIGFCPIKPNIVWASDFTYIKYQGSFIYLATIIDIYTREIVGFNISAYHDTNLVLGAIKHAMDKTRQTPIYLHSDQGSEYDAKEYEDYVLKNNIHISMSHKSSPWENPFQESFYSQFKVDLGYINRFSSVEELIEEIYQSIYYYNHNRIHSVIKMSPINFKNQYENRLKQLRISV